MSENNTRKQGGSETSAAREDLGPFCIGLGMDIGFGGDAIVPTALTMDMIQPYCPALSGDPQIIRGDCRNLSFLCDGVLDYIYSSHLLEDFSYGELVPLIAEWRRVLKPGGKLVANCPDQQRFLSYIAKNNQGNNLAHKEQDFSLETFKDRVLSQTGPWEHIYEMPDDGRYSWYLVMAKA